MTDQPQQRENGAMQQAGTPVPQVQPRPPQVQRVPTANYLGAINAAMEIAGTRFLGLLGVLGALAMFGFAIYDPTTVRTYTAMAYAACVLWPVIYLYLAKGNAG
jgi:hypothetical protein